MNLSSSEKLVIRRYIGDLLCNKKIKNKILIIIIILLLLLLMIIASFCSTTKKNWHSGQVQ
jgi:hypothetical protein